MRGQGIGEWGGGVRRLHVGVAAAEGGAEGSRCDALSGVRIGGRVKKEEKREILIEKENRDVNRKINEGQKRK